MPSLAMGLRLCPTCGAGDTVDVDGALWPTDWCCPACGGGVSRVDGIPMFARDLADTVSGIDPSAFAALKEVEQRHFWFRTRNRLLTGLINRHFPQARSYLEVGCGNGAVLAEVAGLRRWTRLVGSELHPSGLANARERLEPGAEFMQMDARHIPLRSAFELVGAFDVIEHIEEDEAVLTELGAALVPGGGLLLTVPQHPFLWSEADTAAHHVRRYRRGELDAKVRAAGFDILQSTSFLSLLLPLLMASRLASGRRSSRRAAHTTEFAIAPALNRILGAVTDLEVGLTLRGACWPVGGSRVVIARKPA